MVSKSFHYIKNKKLRRSAFRSAPFLSENMENNGLGKFIVIDGIDGSGKATQTKMLIEKLRNFGYKVAMADFPRYGKKSAGLVEKYLNGEYGGADEVGPYRASIFFACDRYDASFEIKKWLKEGKIVITNRYVTASLGHQGGKIANPLERKSYFSWLYELEYEIFNIPRPDLNIILDVDAAIAQKLVEQKGHRDYLNGEKKDIHEADIGHLYRAEQAYLEIANSFPGFVLIKCTRNGRIMKREEIHNLIWQEVKKIIKNENNPLNCGENAAIEKLNKNAESPQWAWENNSELDLFSADYYSLLPGENSPIKIGIKITIPAGYVGLIRDENAMAKAKIYTLTEIINSGYQEGIMVQIINLSGDIFHIAPGQKIARISIQPIARPETTEADTEDDMEKDDSDFENLKIF